MAAGIIFFFLFGKVAAFICALMAAREIQSKGDGLCQPWLSRTSSMTWPYIGHEVAHLSASNLAAHFHDRLQPIFLFNRKWPRPADKTKGENIYNKTRINHFHKSGGNMKTAELPINIHTLMCQIMVMNTSYILYTEVGLVTQCWISSHSHQSLGPVKLRGQVCESLWLPWMQRQY
jgi:hypothetical protein